MKIRITGTRTEVDDVVAAVAGVLDIHDRSEFCPYGNGSGLGRVYLDITGTRSGGPAAGVAGGGPR